MSKEILQNSAPENNLPGEPLTPEILESLRKLFYDLPGNAVAYCDVINGEGDRRRIKHHPDGQSCFVISGPLGDRYLDLADPDSYAGLYILPGTLAAITRNSTDDGLERIRVRHACNALLKLSVG